MSLRMTDAEYQAYLARNGRATPVIPQAQPPKRTLPRHQTGQMNATEARFFSDHIEPSIMAGEVKVWHFEHINLRLGKKCWYRPDFWIELCDGRILVKEIKGGRYEDDARVKFIAAREKFSSWEFECWQWKNKQWQQLWN